MTYPQPDSNKYAIGGSGFFRLNTLLSSPGDIYESEQGGYVIALGPQSDIANVNVAYFDQQVSTFMQFTTVGPSRSFSGLVPARNEAQYSPSHRPGRILFWSDDLYDPSFRPSAFNKNTDTIQFVAPRLDVIQYFSQQPALTPARIDREFVFQNYNVITGTEYIVVPYYGRKYCYIQFTNRDITSNTFGILGVNYCITQDDLVVPYHQETTIRAPAAVALGASVTKLVTAGTTGMFDALVFSFTDAGPAPLRIIMSDVPQGT